MSLVLEAARENKTSRRISSTSEVSVSPSNFAQPIDLDIRIPGNQTKEMPHMPEYPFRSLENTISFIHELKEHGIESVVLRPVGKINELAPASETLKIYLDAVREIRGKFPKEELKITVDPFSVALNEDRTWGVKNQAGRLDYDLTSELIHQIAIGFSSVGVDEILTLGRIQQEVEITRKALSSIQSPTKIVSFSQNSETSTAYIYSSDTPKYGETGQKILIGNMTEMNLQTLIDIYEGTDKIIVKPIENLHLILMTRMFIEDKKNIIDFLISQNVKDLLNKHSKLKQTFGEILLDINSFHEKCKNIRIGSYTVSGTYYLQKKLEQEKGEKFSYALAQELIKNAIVSAGNYLDHIIDRNALWLVKQMNKM